MRWYLRAASLVLISWLSLSQAAIAYCQAACGPEQAHASGMAGESACHSSRADSGASRLQGVDPAGCDHDLPSDAFAAAQQDSFSLRPALQASASPLAIQGEPQNRSHRSSEPRQELRVSGVMPLPLRI